jgi:hypothetical protein
MNFFEAYNKYRRDTEPHQHYHLWSAIYGISCLLGRKVFLPQGHYTVYPQLYVIIVGKAASRKSTAINIAKRLIRESSKVPLAPTSSSREALIDFMAGDVGLVKYSCAGTEYSYRQACAFANEFDTFVGGTHLNKALITFLTDIWEDGDYVDSTRKSGLKKIENPCFNLIGACVPAWFDSATKGDIITGGLTRRTVFVYEDDIDHLEPWPEGSSATQTEVWPALVAEAKRIGSLVGEIKFTDAAIKLQTKLYEEQMKTKRSVGEKVESYYSSRHDLLKKVAMCLSVGFSSNLVVDVSLVELADALLKRTESRLDTLFRGVGRNELNAFALKVLDAVTKKGPHGANRKDLLRTFSADLSFQEFNEAMDLLTQQGRIRPGQIVTSGDIGSQLYFASEVDVPVVGNNSLFERVCQRVPSDSLRPNQVSSQPRPPPGSVPVPAPSVGEPGHQKQPGGKLRFSTVVATTPNG